MKKTGTSKNIIFTLNGDTFNVYDITKYNFDSYEDKKVILPFNTFKFSPTCSTTDPSIITNISDAQIYEYTLSEKLCKISHNDLKTTLSHEWLNQFWEEEDTFTSDDPTDFPYLRDAFLDII